MVYTTFSGNASKLQTQHTFGTIFEENLYNYGEEGQRLVYKKVCSVKHIKVFRCWLRLSAEYTIFMYIARVFIMFRFMLAVASGRHRLFNVLCYSWFIMLYCGNSRND